MKLNFWRKKKVLVTGHEGFLGSNLAKALVALGAKVVGLDIKKRGSNSILDSFDYQRIKGFCGSVADKKLVTHILKRERPEIVFHLAAEAIVAKALKNPEKTFESNIKGTWTMLEACRSSKNIKGIIVASSDKAYGFCDKLPYQENTPLKGIFPYDASKSCTDLLAYSYFRTFKLPVCIVRCGNIYGPGDNNFSRLVPDLLCTALKNKQFVIRSNGKYTRDYIYVLDVVDAYIRLAEVMSEKNISGEAFNLSNEKPISVLQLLTVVNKLFKGNLKKPKILNQAQFEIRDQYLNAKKAKKILGWDPQFSLEEGLGLSLDWYRKQL